MASILITRAHGHGMDTGAETAGEELATLLHFAAT